MARKVVKAVNAFLALAVATVLTFGIAGPFSRRPAAALTQAHRHSSTTTVGISTPPTTVQSAPTTQRATSTTTKSPVTRSPVTLPAVTFPFVTLPPRTVATTSTTSTTIAAIGSRLPPPPATLPFTTKGTNGHVKPLFAMLSGAGFFLALVIMAGRFLMTRPKRIKAGADGVP